MFLPENSLKWKRKKKTTLVSLGFGFGIVYVLLDWKNKNKLRVSWRQSGYKNQIKRVIQKPKIIYSDKNKLG